MYSTTSMANVESVPDSEANANASVFSSLPLLSCASMEPLHHAKSAYSHFNIGIEIQTFETG